MKKVVFFLAFLLSSGVVPAQYAYPYEEIRLDKPASYKENEPLALAAAKLLLTTPYNEEDKSRERAFQFLLKWTGGYKNYDFRLSGVILDVVDEKEVMTLLIAAMTKFCVENPELGNNVKMIEKNAVSTVLTYCNNPANNFRLKKKVRRKLEAA